MVARKTVLLTGARGRLGSALRRSLHGPHFEVVPFSRTCGEGINSLQDLFTPGLWENADVVIHSAWSTVPLLSERNVGMEWEQDLPLLVRLLRAIAGRRLPPHFIFLSSGGTVYGNARVAPSSEEDILMPIGWHGFAKVQAEKLVGEFCRKQGIPYTVLRISNPYGFPISGDKPQGVIPFLIRSALNEQSMRIWGDGSARKDYLHVDDFVAAIAGVIQATAEGVYNLSFGESHSVLELITLIETELSTRISREHLTGYAWDVTDSRLDNSKLRSTISWQPRVSIGDGIRRSIVEIRKAEFSH